MNSPFPGMDPYLEAHWLDVHTSLVSGSRDVLNQLLPPDLVASAEERIAIESEHNDVHRFGPDVRVFEPQSALESDDRGSLAVAAPYRLVVQIEPIIQRFIRIVEVGTERLVSVIEFVSSSNKIGDGLIAFQSKRRELLASGVNFVEIDLVRDGDWRALLRPHVCPRKIATVYRAIMRMPSDLGAAYLHPIALQQRLPSIDIPLRSTDARLQLDLQSLLDRAYLNGRYGRRIDYQKPCEPTLEETDTVWANELLITAGLRQP